MRTPGRPTKDFSFYRVVTEEELCPVRPLPPKTMECHRYFIHDPEAHLKAILFVLTGEIINEESSPGETRRLLSRFLKAPAPEPDEDPTGSAG